MLDGGTKLLATFKRKFLFLAGAAIVGPFLLPVVQACHRKRQTTYRRFRHHSGDDTPRRLWVAVGSVG